MESPPVTEIFLDSRSINESLGLETGKHQSKQRINIAVIIAAREKSILKNCNSNPDKVWSQGPSGFIGSCFVYLLLKSCCKLSQKIKKWKKPATKNLTGRSTGCTRTSDLDSWKK